MSKEKELKLIKIYMYICDAQTSHSGKKGNKSKELQCLLQ